MRFTKDFMKKANHTRKQNWSAPATMGVFILICMFIVYSFELLGLTNKEKNLEFRNSNRNEKGKIYSHLYLVIKAFSQNKFENKKSKINNSTHDISNLKLIDKIKFLSRINKQESQEKMLKILNDGAIEQDIYCISLEYN